MIRTTAPSPIYMDFDKPQLRYAEQQLFDQTVKKIFDGVPNDINDWVDFVTGFSYHDNPRNGEYAYIIHFATFKNCGVEILKQNLDLEPHISVKRNSVAVDVGTRRFYIPVEYANMQDILDVAIKIGSLNETLAKMPTEKAKKSREYALREQLVSVVSQMTSGHYDKYDLRHKTGITYKERQEALVKNLKETLIKKHVLPKETPFRKYHLGKTLDEAYSNCKKIQEKINQKATDKQQNQDQTPEM